MECTDEQFQELIDEAFDSLPRTHRDNVRNVAILFADDPTPEQRQRLQLLPQQSLYGLYEGLPLTQRQGHPSFMPDRITLFKHPLVAGVTTLEELREQVRHTLWHEIAHYYGLDHDKIHDLE